MGLVFIAGMAGLLLGTLTLKGRPAATTASSTQEAGSETVSVFTLVGHTETGRRKWEIQGQTADLMDETVRLSPVSSTSFGEVNVHLTASNGTYQKVRQDVHLEEDVVVTTSDGARLITDTMDWSNARSVATTPDWVTVTRPGMTVVGLGAVGHPNKKQVRMEREITVTLLGQGGKTMVTCDGPMEVDYGRNKARFWRNVRVQDDKGVIQSDRMDVTLDPATKQIQTATCWGHVAIHRSTQVAYCHRAKYWQAAGRTRLAGHTRVVMLAQEGGWQP
ncbi:MAG: LPS export ABC transporter periplasmic protein LptC [Candidatus Omnitrophica bacterium]|nr:LPS export ABC transporter periplasmic protein LptC [Candidatus Omnitrophota bacterium]